MKPPTEHKHIITDYVDTLKQKLAVYSKRLRRYGDSNARKRDNQLFRKNQRSFYRKLRQDAVDPGNGFRKRKKGFQISKKCHTH